MKKTLIISWAFLSTMLAVAQNTGHLGKHFLLKTNAINGRDLGLNCVDIESVIFRRYSIEATLSRFSFSPKEISKITGEINPGGNLNIKVFDEIRTINSGLTYGYLFKIGLRRYFNKIIPAPSGLYMGCDIGFGQARLENYRVIVEYENVDPFEPFTLPGYEINNLSGNAFVTAIEAPFIGYQKLLTSFFTIDTKFSLLTQRMASPSNIRNAFPDNNFIRSNLFSTSGGSWSCGPSIYVKIGFLII